MGEKPQMRSGIEVLEALDLAERRLVKAAEELAKLSTDFHHAEVEEDGEVKLGTGLRYEVALEEEISEIYALAERAEKRPPPEDVRHARAKRAVRTKLPELFAEYYRDKARIDGLKGWVSNQKQAISAAQSLRKGEAP